MDIPLALAILATLVVLAGIVAAAALELRIPPQYDKAGATVAMGIIVIFIVIGSLLSELWKWAV